MRPTFRQLQYILAVADTGKFNDAARVMNVSQPSLSAQIAEAETHLGVTLLERGRTRAKLTPVGEEVARRARIILTQLEDLKSVARLAQQGLAGRYRLGSLPTIGPYLLPRVVRELHRLYPGLLLNVREERMIELDEKLRDGRLDMIISSTPDHPNTDSMHLFDEQLFACAARDDALSEGTGPVGLDELRGRELLGLGAAHRLSVIVHALANAAGAHVSTEYEGTSLDAVRQMAGMGAGVAILPSLYAIVEARRDPAQVVRPIVHPTAHREIGLIWRKGSPLAENIRRLGAVVRDVAKGLLSSEADEKSPAPNRVGRSK